MAWALDLKSRKHGFKFPFRPLAGVVLCSPEFNSSATLVDSLVSLLVVGIFNHVMFLYIICFIVCFLEASVRENEE